ncbi:CD99 antigen-like protein 2 [Stegastes partitus]|uniref:CD99 antigen-like protein 2 n=1 Tax=Stegastes partitus TaxID=144197 RepID=A0A9Y4JMZ6_9TELE|nr:PREDICTED: CD99 antigen-like protein 2 [Stegastes partitus]
MIVPAKDAGLNSENVLPPADGNPPPPGKSRSIGTEDKPEVKESGSGSLAGILSAVGVAAVGAVTGYFTYQKKKLCFKNRQEADPEAAHKADAAEAQSDPQVLSTLLNSS